MKLGGLALLLAVSPLAQGQWTFDEPRDVASGKAFFHLDASGRQAVAVAGERVAIVWEDDRNGVPTCHVASQKPADTGFSQLSFGRGECFAPGITALDPDRFGLIWEDESGVQAAILAQGRLNGQVTLAPAGGQGALAWHPVHGLVAAWSEPENRWRRVWLTRLVETQGRLEPADKQPADAAPLKDDQMFPSLAANAHGFALAWEDRRLGHTVIHVSRSRDGRSWSAPARVSQNPTGKALGTDLGRGTGAMRPALTGLAEQGFALAWLDKRDFLSGYDVYAAIDPGSGFGQNLKVQDSFGDAIAQWHPAIAGNGTGKLVVAWDDDRDGSSDIWLSWPEGKVFSEDHGPSSAAGPETQTDPALTMDASGSLHLVWIDRQENGHTRLRYIRASPSQ